MTTKAIYADSLQGWIVHHTKVPGYFWLDTSETESILCIPLSNMHDVEEFETIEKAKFVVIPTGSILVQIEAYRKKPSVEIPKMIRVLTEEQAYLLTDTHQVYYSPILIGRPNSKIEKK